VLDDGNDQTLAVRELDGEAEATVYGGTGR